MKKVYQKLQLDAILQSVAKHAISDVAKQKIINTIPSNNVEEIRHLLCETEEACRNLSVYNINPEFSFDSVKAQYYYSCSLDISSLEQLPCNIRFGEREKVLVAKTVKTPSTLTTKKVFQSVKEKESELFSSLTDEYGFAGEIYLRLIFEEKPYYYVGVIDKKGNITAFLINAENGNILAKRQS